MPYLCYPNITNANNKLLMENVYFKVAGHSFSILTENRKQILSYLPSYEPFLEVTAPDELLFEVLIVGPQNIYGKEVNRFSWDGSECIIYRGDEGYTFSLYPNGGKQACNMCTNNDFTTVFVSLAGTAEDAFVLNNFVMMTYAFASSSKKTLMIHASVVRTDGKGYLFLGKSGTGKSTHTRLWIETIENIDLINDDNPIVRITDDGIVRVYGSPWSGKTPCYRNIQVPVGAFTKLRQAAANRIEKVETLSGFAMVLSSCSLMKWDEQIYNDICDTVSDISLRTPVYLLDCLPDVSAAKLSYETIRQ